MKKFRTFISISEIRAFYKEKCIENEDTFSEKEFENFVKFCEVDFFDWLSSNYRYFEPDRATDS